MLLPGPEAQQLATYIGFKRAGWRGALVLFAPSFFWIFLGAPAVERLNADPRLRRALSFISAAVLGVILNLALFFALHVLFGTVAKVEWGLLSFQMPIFNSFLAKTLAPLATACAVLFAIKRSVIETIAAAVLVATFTSFF
jgi:chromate transporter